MVKIRKVVNCDNWSYFSGEENPVDIPTRVCELNDFERWFKRPSFLFENNFKSKCFDVETKLNDANVLSSHEKRMLSSTL